MVIKCTCSLCNYKWFYDGDTNEDIIRATCAPCGHQGLFKLKKVETIDD